MSAGSANTERKQPWLFQPGQSGNPAGRPKGSRNKLAEQFLEALAAADFAANGREAIAEARVTNPSGYLKVIASLLPRDTYLAVTPSDCLSDEEAAVGLELVRAAIAARNAAPVKALEQLSDDELRAEVEREKRAIGDLKARVVPAG